MALIRQLQMSLTGIVVLTGGVLAQEPTRPAVRLLPAQPMSPVEGIVARAANTPAFDPLSKPDTRLNDRPDMPRLRAFLDQPKDREPEKPAEPGAWKKFTKWVDNKSTDMKKKLDAPPENQPAPRIGQSNTGGLRGFFEDKPANAIPKEPAKVNAASPAYRWYGYGAVTPGLNPYAPSGEYPNASAQWYVQSGATPGAFPVPTMNPMRPVPGPEAPMYYTATPPMAQPPMPQPIVQPIPSPIPQPAPQVIPTQPKVVVMPSRRTIAETPPIQVPGMVPQVAPPMPSAFSPSNQVPQVPTVPAVSQYEPKMTTIPKAEPAWKPVSATEPQKPATPEPAWKPVETEPLIVPVIRGSAPTLDDSPLARTVQASCKGVATNVVLRETGPRQLVISFQSTTNANAEAAAKAMAALPELKQYSIEFKAGVSK